ncbi:type II toxin-antitoxin system VapB family antitoxin [Mesorhizobium shangrilense]|uniref:Type II toxin-antitoxin system VapB family antitoxin n=1 Tax=Mesorhizobium shangrilense TaxID=460060 RepID=A0ABV2DL22_9HYPH
MAERQLSVRSSKAHDLAHRLARRGNCTIADVVERALESYEVREAGASPHRRSIRAWRRNLARISISKPSLAKVAVLDTNVVSEH